jgi:hypothetical protein
LGGGEEVEMKRILLSVLVIGVLLLGACGAPPAETPPPPPPAEQPPDYTAWIATQLRDLNQAMIQFVSSFNFNYKINKFMVDTGSWWGTRVYSEEQEGVFVHEFMVDAGGSYSVTFVVPASAFCEAKTHINNAYWLTNKSKLPDEVWARDVNADEVAKEVSEALTLLKQQVSSSYQWQEDNIKWITESPTPEPNRPPELQPNRERAIQNLTEVYDDYREELSKVITRLELVLSRLTGTTSAGG